MSQLPDPISSSPSSSNAVFVAVRVRPEVNPGLGSCVLTNPHNTSNSAETALSVVHPEKDEKRFTYDAVFSPHVAQETVYEGVGKQIVDNAMKGYNCSLFAYGQTGSGKTHTMIGDPTGSEVGVIPRLCADLFQRLQRSQRQTPGFGYGVWIEYLELYGEKVRDLLHPNAANVGHSDLKVREHPTRGPYVEGLIRQRVSSAHELCQLMETGNRERHTACTQLNSVSSRSHAVFIVTLLQTVVDGEGHVISSKQSVINLIDLAGSERVSDSGVVGTHLKEAASINTSLSALGQVISALAQNSALSNPNSNVTNKSLDESGLGAGPQSQQQIHHVPYRDSKLTWLLKESLGGNARTVMIATVHATSRFYAETMSTLRYASRCKRVKNRPVVNEDPTARKIGELLAIVQDLRAKVRALSKGELPPGGLNGAGINLSSLEAELQVNNEMMNRLNSVYQKGRSRDDMRADLFAAAASLREMEQDNRRHTPEYRIMRERVLELQQVVGTNDKELDELQEVVKKLNDQRTILAEKNAAIRALKEEFNQHKATANATLEKAHEELGRVRAQESGLKGRLQDEQSALSNLVRSNESEIAELMSKIERARIEAARVRSQRDDLRFNLLSGPEAESANLTTARLRTPGGPQLAEAVLLRRHFLLRLLCVKTAEWSQIRDQVRAKQQEALSNSDPGESSSVLNLCYQGSNSNSIGNETSSRTNTTTSNSTSTSRSLQSSVGSSTDFASPRRGSNPMPSPRGRTMMTTTVQPGLGGSMRQASFVRGPSPGAGPGGSVLASPRRPSVPPLSLVPDPRVSAAAAGSRASSVDLSSRASSIPTNASTSTRQATVGSSSRLRSTSSSRSFFGAMLEKGSAIFRSRSTPSPAPTARPTSNPDPSTMTMNQLSREEQKKAEKELAKRLKKERKEQEAEEQRRRKMAKREAEFRARLSLTAQASQPRSATIQV